MRKLLAILALLGLVLSGCGGGSDSTTLVDSPDPTVSTLSGTAAAGAPIIGQVTVKDSSTPVKTVSAVIEADGNYSVDVTGMTAPYMLRAEGSVGGRVYKLHSFAQATDVGETINITPFTDLIVANAAGQLAETLFDNDTFSGLSAEEVAAQETALQDKLQSVLTSLGVSSAIDLLHTAFSADHTALDAALDMVRVSVDPVSDIATITNLIDATSITDNIADLTDNATVLPVTSDLAVVLTTQQTIYNTFANFTALFAAGLPNSTQLSPFIAADFLAFDQGKDQIITNLTTDPSLIGMGFVNVVIDALDEVAGTATVTFNFSNNGIVDPEPATWYMAKNGDTWEMRGNQEIVDRSYDFQCNYDNWADGSTSTSCGMNLDVRDNDFTNNGTSGAPIASAKVTVIHNGQAVPNSDVYMGVPEGGTAGELFILDWNYSDDYIVFGSAANEFNPALVQAGDSLQFDLYTAALDTVTPAVIGAPVATYTTPVLADPVTDAAGSSYPNATQATLDAFYALPDAGGDLPVSWSVPTGQHSSELALMVCDGSSCVDVWADMPSNGTTLTIDTSSLDSVNAPYSTELRVYTRDALGREFLHTYHGTTGGSAPTPTVTGFTTAMLDTLPTFYLSYSGNPDGTLTTGITQEVIVVVSGSNGSYQVEYTDTYYDTNNTQVSSVTNTAQLTLNQDGTLTALTVGDPTPTVFTLTGSTETSITVSATYATETWTDTWYFAPPATWISSPATTAVFTTTMLDAQPTFYISYPGNPDGTIATGTTQESFAVTGTGGTYQLTGTQEYFDASNVLQSTVVIPGTAVLNPDATLTVNLEGNPTITFAASSSTADYLVVAGSDGVDSWTDIWYFAPPATWISSAATPAMFTTTMLDAQPTFYITYPGNSDGTISEGTTQETIAVTGTGGNYTFAITEEYFDASNVLQSSGTLPGTAVLNQDGTLTVTLTGNPTMLFTVNSDAGDYLIVTGSTDVDTWTDTWYLIQPANWIIAP